MAVASLDQTLAARVVRSPLLDSVPGIRHGITARVSGMGAAHGNVAFSPPRDQDDAWNMRRSWCAALALDPEAIVTAGQVHGATPLLVGEAHRGNGARPGSGRAGLGDALLTRDPGPVLLTLHADCLPILLVDPERPAVAAVHAGWRGTVEDVVGAAVRAMGESFESRPEGIIAFLGPAICRACYEVGADVAAAWSDTAGDAARTALEVLPSSWQFDLHAANRVLLARAGVRSENIDASSICTRCGEDDWFSHRGQGPNTGRFGAMIAITETRR